MQIGFTKEPIGPHNVEPPNIEWSNTPAIYSRHYQRNYLFLTTPIYFAEYAGGQESKELNKA